MPRPLAYQSLKHPLPLFQWSVWLKAAGLEILLAASIALTFSGFDVDLDDDEEAVIGFAWLSLSILASWAVFVPWFARGLKVRSFPTRSWFGLAGLRILAFPLAERLTPWRDYADPDDWFSEGWSFLVTSWLTATVLVGVGCFIYPKVWEKRARLEKCKSN